jgi:hypothetical protein
MIDSNESPREEQPPEPEGERAGQKPASGVTLIVGTESFDGVPPGTGLAETLRAGGREAVHSASFWNILSFIVDEKEKELIRLRGDLKIMTGDREGWRKKHQRLAIQLATVKTKGEIVGKLAMAQSLLVGAGGILVGVPAVPAFSSNEKVSGVRWAVGALGVAAWGAAWILVSLAPATQKPEPETSDEEEV